jgi:hypothetical protein
MQEASNRFTEMRNHANKDDVSMFSGGQDDLGAESVSNLNSSMKKNSA